MGAVGSSEDMRIPRVTYAINGVTTYELSRVESILGRRLTKAEINELTSEEELFLEGAYISRHVKLPQKKDVYIRKNRIKPKPYTMAMFRLYCGYTCMLLPEKGRKVDHLVPMLYKGQWSWQDYGLVMRNSAGADPDGDMISVGEELFGRIRPSQRVRAKYSEVVVDPLWTNETQ